MKMDKNTMLGLGLLVGAFLIYKHNSKIGVATVGVNAPIKSNFSGCASCSSADGENDESNPFWGNSENW